MATDLLQIKNLVKHYPSVKAVNGIDITLQAGICFGLLGPNGAGKTTTVEILEGINSATSGEILYKGQPLGDQFRKEAGIMFQSTALQDFITVRETLTMFSQFYPQHADLDQLILRCNLTEYLDQDNRQLSGGQRQRLLLAIALVNNPDIIFLDEPTTGLDPQARRNFWNLINDIKEEGKTIVLTTHYMDEAYSLCDEIAIMDHGKIIAQGTPKSLLEENFNDVILQLPESELQDIDLSMYTIHKRNSYIEITTCDVNEAVSFLNKNNVSLSKLQIRPRTLDDLFLELTGKELRA
ncbi:MAG: ABC transporter ATP-binding protein [Gammaproteobacteria bacterium]|nr:ABC transporter ATP-binding protein [Gammaproteobacteria bacterium]MCW8987880.1 ABC transporter ATP-binding protein [Gammaproteobacteria bacterium]MCW9031943.1 ABC transporter ATP-binding protein [Gammaproteobacteria bacterium]